MSTDRRRFLRNALTAIGAGALAGCDRLSQTDWAPNVLAKAETLSHAVQRALSRNALAREYGEADISPVFRANGSTNPQTPEYVALAQDGFRDYRLKVGGLVAHPLSLSLEELRALPPRTQITRHDCVEGWSVIGKWKGVQLSRVLELAQPRQAARYVLFRCFDRMPGGGGGTPYYESIGFDDAWHPQTLLAYELNDRPLPIANGAPLRARIERQLGYKQAKYISAIELVDSLDGIGGGKGGYWEDQGYEWYAGI
ncbi:MAG TPA: molybdopterin-dependent oxidoreductase [Rhodanobacteraceae bacterium]|nr:molybdopterin-dependent oxidoreductase [Rhodanobacteraceae bacterium]